MRAVTHSLQMWPPALYLWLMCKGGQPCGCVPEAVWVHMAEQGVCPCANTSKRAQCEHIWAYEEGEVFQVWQPHTAACTQVPARAGGFAHEHAPTAGRCHVSEQAGNMCPCVGIARLPPCRRCPVTHHPLLSRRVVSDHQHHGAAGSERRKGPGQGLAWANSTVPGPLYDLLVRLLPQRLGVGHSPRPVDVQVPAADGGERRPV